MLKANYTWLVLQFLYWQDASDGLRQLGINNYYSERHTAILELHGRYALFDQDNIWITTSRAEAPLK